MKTINISTLKAKASSTFRQVRRGMSFVVVSHDVPIAEIIPYREKPALVIREPKQEFVIPPVTVTSGVDPLAYLLDDRSLR